MSPDPRFGAALAAVATLLLAGCAVGPDHRTPVTTVAAEFSGAAASPFDRGAPLPLFWTEFRDPQLESLVAQALAANHDLRIADARLAQARALGRESRYDLAPTVTAGAEYERTRLSRDAARPTGAREFENYRAGFDLAWELDLFGGIRRGIEARDAQTGAAAAARRAVSVAVASEVARNYFELRGLQLRLAVAERNLANQRETARLTEARLAAGRGTELDVARARAQLNATLATLPAIDGALTATRYRLAVLTGREPTALDAALAEPRPLPALPALVAVGTPEEWLRRRPDIARAERELAVATARVGVAMSDLFPKVSLVGSFGSAAFSFDELDGPGGNVYSIVPGLRWAAFDLGRVKARIAAEEAGADGALAAYEKTVLTALEETEGALTAYRNALLRRQALSEAHVASVTAARLARIRYDEGVADFLAVLDAERTLLDAEDRLASAETDTATRLVAVYKALGAGWDAEDPRLARAGAGP